MDLRKTRGGQKKHWAEKARVWAWYADVKQRGGLTDYQMDNEFAWRSRPESAPTSDERPRTFEWIRKSARIPRGLDPRWRNMKELIEAIDEDPRFRGARRLYEAEIWGLLQERHPDPTVVLDRINRILNENDLVRLPLGKIFEYKSSETTQYSESVLFDRCLRLSLRRVDRLTALSLLWSLYLHAESAHSAKFRSVIEVLLDKHLGAFFARFFPKTNLELYDESLGALLGTRLDLTSREVCGYGSLESTSTWPVFPKAMVGKLSVEELALNPFDEYALIPSR